MRYGRDDDRRLEAATRVLLDNLRELGVTDVPPDAGFYWDVLAPSRDDPTGDPEPTIGI